MSRRPPILPAQEVYRLVQARRQHSMIGRAPLRAPDFAPFEEPLARRDPARAAEVAALLRGATIPDIQSRMAAGRLSAAELALHYIARTRRFARLNSVIELNPEALAIAAALDAERAAGQSRGPLHGIPILLKDNIGTGDQMHTTAGAAALLEARCDRDAFIAARLRQAGALLLGKTNMSEWANYMSTRSASGWSAVGGQTRNPLGRFDVGGSSSGSGAAVAAGLAVAAVGTETYGSIISPSGRCGLVGHKPSHGLVSRDRIIPITDATDTAGPMARSTVDAAILLQALAGEDPADPDTLALAPRPDAASLGGITPDGLRGRRVGWLVPWARRVGDEAAVARTVAALRAAGAEVVEVPYNLPKINLLPIMDHGFRAGLAAYFQATGAPVRSVEDVIAFNRRDMRRYAPRGQAILERAARETLSDAGYADLVEASREHALTAIRALMAQHRIDLLLAFSTNAAFNMAGVPILSMPVGALPQGDPAQALLVADLGRDAELLAAGHALEQALRSSR